MSRCGCREAPGRDHRPRLGRLRWLRSSRRSARWVTSCAPSPHICLPAPTCCARSRIPSPRAEVLIVGQDPYPTPGHPIGLSFAVAPDVRPLPPSLVNIYTELVSDLGVPTPSTGDLRPWAQRGVVLLNRVLTVAPGSPRRTAARAGSRSPSMPSVRWLRASVHWWRSCGAATPRPLRRSCATTGYLCSPACPSEPACRRTGGSSAHGRSAARTPRSSSRGVRRSTGRCPDAAGWVIREHSGLRGSPKSSRLGWGSSGSTSAQVAAPRVHGHPLAR
jgi:hypothetical protein